LFFLTCRQLHDASFLNHDAQPSPLLYPNSSGLKSPRGKKNAVPSFPPPGSRPPPPAGAGTAGTARTGAGPGPDRGRTGAGPGPPGPDRGRTAGTGPGGTQQTPPPPKAAGEPQHHSTALKKLFTAKLTQGHRITPNNKKKKKSYLILPRIKGHTR